MAYVDKLSAGGGIYALTATPIAIDLTSLVGYEVTLSCAAAIYFSGAPNGTNTTLVTTATAASKTALIADPLAGGFKARRLIRADQPFLIVATQTGTGTLTIKVVSDHQPGL